VRSALQGVPGCQQADIDFEAQTAIAVVTGDTTPQALCAAVSQAGYGCRPL
jgi:copper chaperone CopZ